MYVLHIITASISLLASQVRMPAKWFEESGLSTIANIYPACPALFPVIAPLGYTLSCARACLAESAVLSCAQ